jgi:hypothetical protein
MSSKGSVFFAADKGSRCERKMGTLNKKARRWERNSLGKANGIVFGGFKKRKLGKSGYFLYLNSEQKSKEWL